MSLGFALRSFSNLNRFLELVPVVAARLVGVQGSLLVPFQADGRLWRDQLQILPGPRTEGLLRALAAHEPGNIIGFGSDESLVRAMDRLVQRQLGSAGLFATSLIARGRPRGRLSCSIRRALSLGVMFIADMCSWWLTSPGLRSKMI